MRLLTAAVIALLLAACSPPAPPQQPQSSPDGPPPAAANPDAAMLASEPMPGQWSFNGDAGTISAGFGAPESEYLFLVVCNAPTGRITLTYEHELAPDQDTTLKIVTAAQTLDFAARSFNEGLPNVSAEVEGADPRLAALAATQERIAVEVGGETSVLPWDQSIARVLQACRD